jgi:hypothetical protein
LGAACGGGDDTATRSDTASDTSAPVEVTDPGTAGDTTNSEATTATSDTDDLPRGTDPSDDTSATEDTEAPGTTSEPDSSDTITGSGSSEAPDSSDTDRPGTSAPDTTTGTSDTIDAADTTNPSDPSDPEAPTTSQEPLEVPESVAVAVGRRITPNAATLTGDLGEELSEDDVSTATVSDVVCPAAFEEGAALRCDFTERFVWVVEKGEEARVTVLLRDGQGGATPVLWAFDDTGFGWASIAVVAHDLTGDGVDELIVGFRNAGSGGFLDLDVVANDGQVVLHRSLDRGAADLVDGTLMDFRAKVLEGEPNCCPSEYVKTVIDYVDGAWRLLEQSPLPTDDVPRGAF